MWGFIKWTVMWTLILCGGLVCVTWLQLSAQERMQWKHDLLLVIDEGNTQPLRCTIQHDAGQCAKRFLRRFVLWMLQDVDEKQPTIDLPQQTTQAPPPK
ncbi:MAG: hypothetical protein AAF320_05485 [Myxococcota bacterium]